MVQALEPELEALAALPQLSVDELIPEITSLRLDKQGRLNRVEHRAPLIITYNDMRRRVTGRFVLGAHPSIEIGCRLARIPYTIEKKLARDRLLLTVERIQRAGVGRLGITHRRELHLRDEIAINQKGLGAEEMLHTLVVAGLTLRPVFRWLDALDLPLP